MSTITLSAPLFYKAGKAGVSGVAGFESGASRVVRYQFTAPAQGASGLRLAFSGNGEGNGSKPALAFYIGTDPDEYAAAGPGYAATGELELQSDGLSYAGSASVLLMPGDSYYLWVFPTTSQFGWVYWSWDSTKAVVQPSGGATSALEAAEGVLGQAMTLSVTRYGQFTHTVTCAFGDATETVCENSAEESLTWTPPLSLAHQIPTAVAGVAQFTIHTYSADGLIGSRSLQVRLTLPEDITPTVSCRYTDKSAHRSLFDGLLQNLSSLEVTVESAGSYSSTIRSTAVSLNGKPYAGGVITDSGTMALSVKVTDSRGRTASTGCHIFVEPYEKPRLTLLASRCDEDGAANDMGEFALITLQPEFTELSTSLAPVLTLQGQTVTEETAILPAPGTESPTFTATFTDAVGIAVTASRQISVAYATMDFLAGGKGIAFGTTAVGEGFACAMPARFTAGVEIGGPVKDVVIEQGVSGIWYYRKWQSGLCELYGMRDLAYLNDNTLTWYAAYPFALTKLYCVSATCNYAAAGASSWCYPWNTKAEATTTGCTVLVQSSSAGFNSANSFGASAAIIGLWK